MNLLPPLSGRRLMLLGWPIWIILLLVPTNSQSVSVYEANCSGVSCFGSMALQPECLACHIGRNYTEANSLSCSFCHQPASPGSGTIHTGS